MRRASSRESMRADVLLTFHLWPLHSAAALLGLRLSASRGSHHGPLGDGGSTRILARPACTEAARWFLSPLLDWRCIDLSSGQDHCHDSISCSAWRLLRTPWRGSRVG